MSLTSKPKTNLENLASYFLGTTLQPNRMTPCVMQKYDELFGKDYNMAFKKNLHLIDTVTPGVADVSSVTGCLQPCDSYQYPTHVYLSYGIRFANDLMTKKILESTGSNSSSLIVIDYIQKGGVISDWERPLMISDIRVGRGVQDSPQNGML